MATKRKKTTSTEPKNTKRLSIDDVTNATQAEVARAFGLCRSTVYAWSGCPQNKNKNYSLPDVIAWRVSRALDDAGYLDVKGPKTESLERVRRAQAEKIELQNAVTKNDLVPVADMRDRLSYFCSTLRKAGEKIQKLFGADAYEILNDAINEAQAHVKASLTKAEETE